MPAHELYEPELGQFVFGQPAHALECPEKVIRALDTIAETMSNDPWSDSPFGNTGAEYHTPIFSAVAYSWNEDENQEWNFKWRDIHISWYKHFHRGVSINRIPSDVEIGTMVRECVEAINAKNTDNA